ncbi:uncharacterized protein LOC115217409 [Octopus sinensis]|uniref:Uncharacterized protein LOC115217409 n=1 Tax=Octopus sinensis TaxID=2607531 RepID=A0A6P7SXR9_9MOLL|nr:uncharacterized protein LOC115217409 [Octopus sinensis]XP_029642962.1 uncharacterized protein LOC115217409 [Octopus sinensis]XP_036363364.1 uncharacterized protein LOC115217409 [Octopus sinensis]XP_036363365.1 uncharacterized protein LOC115217409 [Octopus sinensis]
MEINLPIFKKPKIEDNGESISSSETTVPDQTKKYVTQVFLIPPVNQYKPHKTRRTRLKYSLGPDRSSSGSCGSGITQSAFVGKTDNCEKESKKSQNDGIISENEVSLSSSMFSSEEKCYDNLSDQGYLPISEGACSLLSEKESGNESGYSSHSAGYIKDLPMDKRIENLSNANDPLVDINSVESKQSNLSESSSGPSDKRMRFLRTASALQRSGLMDITMKTADILKQNRIVNKEIERLHQDTLKFLHSVINNPENKTFQDTITRNCDKHS